MKKMICFVLVLSGVCGVSSAQTAAEPAAAPAVAQANDTRTHQEKKVAALADQFFAASEALEKRIDELVTELASVRDSASSGTKIADTKKEVIEKLKASIDTYRVKRQKIEAELRRPASYWDSGALEKAEGFQDERIQKRAGQILELVNSLYDSTEYKEFRTVYQEDGWGNVREVEDTQSKEYKQAKKADQRAEKVGEETRETIEQRIVDLENRTRWLKEQVAATVDAERKSELERQVAANEARLAESRALLSQVGEAGSGGAEPVSGSSEARDIEARIRSAAAALKAEHTKLDMLGSQLMQELGKLDSKPARP
jgi:hypothetical protein